MQSWFSTSSYYSLVVFLLVFCSYYHFFLIPAHLFALNQYIRHLTGKVNSVSSNVSTHIRRDHPDLLATGAGYVMKMRLHQLILHPSQHELNNTAVPCGYQFTSCIL